MKLYITILFFLISFSAVPQKYFKVEEKFNCQCGSFTKKLDNLTRYTPAIIKSAFDSIAVKSGIEFNYPQGGCQQRAEMMHIILSDLKMEHVKVWLFAPVNLLEGSNTYLRIKDKNGLATDSIITWGYHVALAVLVSENNKTDTLVIDPSIYPNAPVQLKQWLNTMENSTLSEYTFLEPKYYFFNTQNGGASKVINGYFYTYDPAPGLTTMYDNATLERELAVNDVAIFLKKKLDAGYKDSKGEIRQLLSNVNNMVSFFASQQRCNTLLGVSMRQLLVNHYLLINEAFEFYNKRVVFWTQKVSSLK